MVKRMDIVKIGEKIKERSKALNLTQKDLADALHISDRLVSKWETGESVPLLEYIQPLSEVLKTSERVLMGIDAEPTADTEQPNPPAPKPKEPNKAKIFWEKNRKPLIISIISVASALFILSLSLLSAFVFAPLSNKKNYLEARDRGIDRYLELGYFNIRITGEVDGDEDKNPGILQGYIDENGRATYYNSETDEIVKDGIKTYRNKKGQFDYNQPASVKTASDLLEVLLESWDDDDDLFDLEEYVTYIRKTVYGYYMEFSKDYILGDLKPSQIKNIKFTEKIKGKVIMDGNKLKSITVTAKFRNTKENEKFTIVNKIEFLQQKPVIEHRNYVETAPSELVSNKRFAQLINAASAADTISEEAKYYLSDGRARCDNGYIFAVDFQTVYIFDPNTLEIAEKITINNGSGAIQEATVYGGAVWYVYPSTTSEWTLYRYDINKKDSSYVCYVPAGQVAFNYKYFYCSPNTWASYRGFAFDLEWRMEIASTNLYNSEYIEYVDREGRVYCWQGYPSSLYLYGSNESIKGDKILLEENGCVYTSDNDGIYQYRSGVYQRTVSSPKKYMTMQGGFCFDINSDTLYDLDGNLVVKFPQVILKTGGNLGYMICDVEILAVCDDVVLVNLIRNYGDKFSNNSVVGFYRVGKWDAPVAFTEITTNKVSITFDKDHILCVCTYYYYDENTRYWLIKRK